MKCLIIAAGKGSRLSPKGNTKPLIRLLGVPLVERVVRSVVQAGVDDFYVVSGYNGDQLRPFLDAMAHRCRIRISHLINDAWEQGNGLSVLRGKECLSDPFLLVMADHLFDPSIVRDLTKCPPRAGEITLAIDRKTSNPIINLEDVTRVECKNGKVSNIGKGLSEFDAFDTGIFLCTPALFEALEQNIAQNGDTSLSGGVRHMAIQGKVNCFEIGGRFWLDLDDPADFSQAEKALLVRSRGKTNDGPVSRYLNRPISIRLSRTLAKLPVTPNQISMISFLLSLLAAGLLAVGGYPALAAGGALAQLASVIDGCDGEVARLKFLASAYGGWFDAVLDRYADAFLLFGLAWHAHAAGDPRALVVGFLAVIGSFMVSYTADKYDNLMRSAIESGKSFRLGRDVKVFLIFLGALFNQAFLTLVLISVVMNAEVVRRVWVCRD